MSETILVQLTLEFHGRMTEKCLRNTFETMTNDAAPLVRFIRAKHRSRMIHHHVPSLKHACSDDDCSATTSVSKWIMLIPEIDTWSSQEILEQDLLTTQLSGPPSRLGWSKGRTNSGTLDNHAKKSKWPFSKS